MTKKEIAHINMLLDILKKVTVRISSFNNKGQLISRGSGFIYQPLPKDIPIIITAGHDLPKKGNFIDTQIKKDGNTLLINAGEFHIFYNNDEDYAYSELPIELYKNEMEKYKDVDFLSYQHNFKAAIKDEVYGFAVINDNAEFVIKGDSYTLPSYFCYEIGMELEEQGTHFNYFKLSRKFQGHEHYEGASGSPIVDAEGIITSILVGGDDKKDLLKAFRLDNIEIIKPKV